VPRLTKNRLHVIIIDVATINIMVAVQLVALSLALIVMAELCLNPRMIELPCFFPIHKQAKAQIGTAMMVSTATPK